MRYDIIGHGGRHIAPGILDSIEGNETVGLYGIFTMPRWPFVVCVLSGCALTLAQYAMLTIGFAIRAFGPGHDGGAAQ